MRYQSYRRILSAACLIVSRSDRWVRVSSYDSGSLQLTARNWMVSLRAFLRTYKCAISNSGLFLPMLLLVCRTCTQCYCEVSTVWYSIRPTVSRSGRCVRESGNSEPCGAQPDNFCIRQTMLRTTRCCPSRCCFCLLVLLAAVCGPTLSTVHYSFYSL